MQQQAAPARFSGTHNIIHHIPIKYIPSELLHLLKHPNSRYHLQERGQNLCGRYPYLLMRIKDPQIKRLAGIRNTRTDNLMNSIWQHDCPLFDDIDCADISCTCSTLKEHDFQQIYGQTPIDPDTILYRSCKRTIFAAAKRQIKASPHPDIKVAREFVEWAKDKIDQWMHPYLSNFKYSYDQWYNHLTAKKQQDMDKVWRFIHSPDGCEIAPHCYHYTTPTALTQELHYEGLAKKELQPIDGKPRMVCSIPPLIKFVMGPITWALEEIFAKHFPVYCGGMNFTQMEEKVNHYLDEGFEIVTEGDGSAFDNTQDAYLKSIDRYIYSLIADKVYHVPKELFLFIANQYYKILDIKIQDPYSKKKITLMSYAVLGTVFSGDCDTTLMNTVRMGLYNWFTNHKMGLELGEHYVCFSKGDDFTVMYNPIKIIGKQNMEEGYRRYWLAKLKPNGDTKECDDRTFGLGQILKFIEFGEGDSLKFCSLRAWIKDQKTGHVYLTRDPMRLFTQGKYSRKFLGMHTKEKVLYLLQQAEALEISYPKIDIFREIAKLLRHEANILVAQAGPIKQEEIKRYAKLTIDKMRRTLTGESLANMFDAVGMREDNEIMVDGLTYWESMSKIYYINLTQLTDEEAQEVNGQINAEFGQYLTAIQAGPLLGTEM